MYILATIVHWGETLCSTFNTYAYIAFLTQSMETYWEKIIRFGITIVSLGFRCIKMLHFITGFQTFTPECPVNSTKMSKVYYCFFLCVHCAHETFLHFSWFKVFEVITLLIVFSPVQWRVALRRTMPEWNAGPSRCNQQRCKLF